jgi:CheY-like chemotaxis protein
VKDLLNAVELGLEKETRKKEQKKILVVDDDGTMLRTIKSWLDGHYRVSMVNSGINAITFLAKNQVDLILLDYEMPVVDGPQVLQMFRQEEATAHIPVVFLTGNGTKEAVERVMSLKPDGYILKSTTRENLLGYLRKKLG